MKEVYTNISLRELLIDHDVEILVGVTSDKKIFIKVRILSYFVISGLFVVPYFKKCHSLLVYRSLLDCILSRCPYVMSRPPLNFEVQHRIILSSSWKLDFTPPWFYAMNLCVRECFVSRICIQPYNFLNRWC